MKVLVASHTYIVDLNCQKLRALVAQSSEIEVTVVVPKRWRPGGVQNRTITTEYRQEDRFQIVPVSNFSQNNQGLLLFGADLIALLLRVQPDIIQVEQGAKALGYAQLITLNRLLGLKARNLFFTWWNLPYELKFPVAQLEQYNLQHTHGAIVGNQDGVEVLRQRGYQGLAQVMPQLGVDETRFCPQSQPDLAADLGITSKDFVVGFVGRFVEEKGLLTLAQALQELGHLPWKWLLLGRGPLQAALMEATAEMSDRLIWVESVPHDEVYRYLNLMHTLVLPSQTSYRFKTLTAIGWKEQFGHVLIEAMACRVPVIGSDSGEIPHVIGTAGLIFPEGDAIALQSCLSQLMEQPTLAAELGQQGYDRAMTHFTNRALACQQLSFYEQVLQDDR